MYKAFITLAAVAAATTAFAGPTHLSDVQYLQANRCSGLQASPALGGGDDSAMRALIRSEGGARPQYIFEKGEELRRDALREAKRAGDERKVTLAAERDGACQALLGAPSATTAAGAAAAHSSQ